MSDRHIAGLQGYGTKRRLPRASPCRPCNAANPQGGFTTVDVGATSAGQCICAAGFGGPGCGACPTVSVGCGLRLTWRLCLTPSSLSSSSSATCVCINHAAVAACCCCCCFQGTFSEGGRDAVCQSCPGAGAGYTTAYQASTSVTACVCIPGYGMTDKGLCRLCPANTYSEGFQKEDCKPCPFGYTSPPGSHHRKECVPSSQPCPVGQIAPEGAVSPDQCVCLPGHGGKQGI